MRKNFPVDTNQGRRCRLCALLAGIFQNSVIERNTMIRHVMIPGLLLAITALTSCTSRKAVSHKNGITIPEAVAPTANRATHSKVHPHWMNEEDNERWQDARERGPKHLDRDY